MAYGLAALSASAFAGLDLLRANGCSFRAPCLPGPVAGRWLRVYLGAHNRFAGRLNSGVRALLFPLLSRHQVMSLKTFASTLLVVGLLALLGIAFVASRPNSSDAEVKRAEAALAALTPHDNQSGAQLLTRLQAEADLRGAEQKAPLRRQEMISYLAALSLVSLALGTILLSRAQRSRSAP